mgnify:CR=1 FL=1
MAAEIKKAKAELADLEDLGWDFDPWIKSVMDANDMTYEEAKEYEFSEGISINPTIGNQKTIEDLKTLHSENKLWDVEYY